MHPDDITNGKMHIHIQNRPHKAFLPLIQAMIDPIATSTNHRFTLSRDDEGFEAALPTMEILVTTADQVKARFPCLPPKLKAVFLTHAGIDGLEGTNLLPTGVMLLNNSGVHARKAGEFVLMATLMLANDMHIYMAQQEQRIWKPRFAQTLSGLRVTIVGVGGLGTGAAKALRPLGVHLTGVRNSDHPHPSFDCIVQSSNLDATLEKTGMLVLAAPLTQSTHQMIGAKQLRCLPETACIINIGRGELIDQAALVTALQQGQIAGAVLDVQETEPVPAEAPLWNAPNLIITPHVSCTDAADYGPATLRVLMENVAQIQQGQIPENRVDPSRGY